MYQPFFEKDITSLESEKTKALELEKLRVSSEIKEIESLLYHENDMEENQKDYLVIGELEKNLSDLKIRLNTIIEDIDRLESE